MCAFRSPPDSGHTLNGDQFNDLGQAVVTLVQRAAELSLDDVKRAMTIAHNHALQLRAAEDRIKQLEEEVKHLEARAIRAEGWLATIKKEVEEKLIAAIETNRTRQPLTSENSTVGS